MGQYYLVVNKTKKQFLYPHAFGDGLKAWEFVAGGAMLKALGYLLVTSDEGGGGDLRDNPLVGYWAGDEIIIVGDYDSSKLYDEAIESYTDISTTVIHAMTNPDQGIFDKKALGLERYYMQSYFKKNPVIPFEKLNNNERVKSNTNPVAGTAVQHLALDPDMLEIV